MNRKIGLTRAAVAVLALGTFAIAPVVRAQGNSDHPTKLSRGHEILNGNSHNGPRDSGGGVATGNGINYNGGPVMHAAHLYYILYGNWGGLDPTGPAILQTWGSIIAPTSYYAINTTYGDSSGGSVPNGVTFEGTYTDTGSLGTTLSDASIGTLTSNAINHGFPGSPYPAGVPDPDGLYMVLTAPGVAESSGFLSQYCGWHWSGSFVSGSVKEGYVYSGYTVVKFAFIGNAAGPSFGACAAQSISPNGDAGADAMISVMAHELSEAVSDPEGNAWYASNGEENGDLCAWNFGSMTRLSNGAYYNVSIGGYNYLMQQIWLNANGGSCALAYNTAPDFNVSVSGAQTMPPGEPSGTYTATETPSGGFTGMVSWTWGSTAGLTLSPTSTGTGSTFTFTLTAAPGMGAGTYTIPVTGTSGTLVHTANAALVVSGPQPGFAISIPTSPLTVTPPRKGSATAAYTVQVNGVNGFTGAVNLSASGGTSGVSVSVTKSVNAGSTGTLTVSVNSRAKAGTYTLTVSGSASGLQTQTATTTITVN